MTKKGKPVLNPAALKAAFGHLGYELIPKESPVANIPSTKDAKPIALAMMIKNEEKRIEVSFDSVKDISKVFVILDTGSTDRTLEICRQYCAKHGITLHLKEEPFVNFCISRNVLLDYADEVLVINKKPNPHYLLLLDCNDELRNQNELLTFANTYNGPSTGFHLKQQWWTGNSLDTYFNIRMTLSHNHWRYRGVVHEYICQPEGKSRPDSVLKLDQIVLYQDRTKDDDKSMRRFHRDKDLLYSEYVKDPTEPRTIFYLAQTCSCLGQHAESYMYYYERTKQDGFIEEKFHAYYRLGELSLLLGHAWEESLHWYLKAFSHSSRVEPLIRIIEYYRENSPLGDKKEDLLTAYMYASMACKLLYPHQQILFVDRQAYLHRRWSLLGIVAYYVGRYKEGKDACIKALQAEPDSKIDQQNLILYLQKDKEINAQLLHKSLQFPASVIINTESGEYTPDLESGAGYGTKMTRDDVLKRALTQYLNESKKK